MTKAAELAKMGEVLTNSQIGGRRNIVINGAMQISQRSTSVTGIGASATYFTVDRLGVAINGTTAGRVTMSQASDGPSGFANSMKYDVTTADTSIASSESFGCIYRIEGQDVQQFKKGTSDAERGVLSFYVKGTAKTFVVEIRDDNSRQQSHTFSVTSEWSRVVIPITADTTGAIDDDNTTGLTLVWWLHAGTDFTSGTISNDWVSSVNANRMVGCESIFSSTDNEFFITGIQLEVGEQATPFEHRSFGEELALCQRYYHSTTFANGKAASAGGTVNSSTIAVIAGMAHPVIMRAAPVAAINDVTHIGVRHRNTVTTCTNATISTSQRACTMELTVSSGLTVGNGCFARSVNNSCTLSFDIEL